VEFVPWYPLLPKLHGSRTNNLAREKNKSAFFHCSLFDTIGSQIPGIGPCKNIEESQIQSRRLNLRARDRFETIPVMREKKKVRHIPAKPRSRGLGGGNSGYSGLSRDKKDFGTIDA